MQFWKYKVPILATLHAPSWVINLSPLQCQPGVCCHASQVMEIFLIFCDICDCRFSEIFVKLLKLRHLNNVGQSLHGALKPLKSRVFAISIKKTTIKNLSIFGAGFAADISAHHTGSVGVIGSNPICSTTTNKCEPHTTLYRRRNGRICFCYGW